MKSKAVKLDDKDKNKNLNFGPLKVGHHLNSCWSKRGKHHMMLPCRKVIDPQRIKILVLCANASSYQLPRGMMTMSKITG